MAATVASISVAKTLISNSWFSISRRSIASAVSRELGHVSSGSRPNIINERSNKTGESDNSWGPDPITGFYRPVNRSADIDVADLRNMLFKNRITAN